MHDQILVEELALQCHIGVSDEERAAPQRLTVTLTLTPQRDFTNLRDDIRNAIDYHKVAIAVQALAAARPRRLLETLAIEIAEELLTHFLIQTVDLHLRKYFLPDAGSTGVRIHRERGAATLRMR